MLVTSLAPISWGATYYVTAAALPADSPWWGAALRALPAGLLLLLIVRRRPRGRWWLRSVILGSLNFGGFFVLIYAASHLLPTSVAASVMALAPLVLAGLAWPLLGERPTMRLLIAATLGILGVVLLVGISTAGAHPLGVLASGTALLISSLGAILTTRWRDDQPLLATTSWQLVAGGLLLVILAIALEGAPPVVPPSGVAAYAGIAVIATAVAFLCWFSGLRHLPAGTVGTIGLLNPVTGILCGVLLAGENLTAPQLSGMALIAAAILLGRSRSRRRTPADTAAVVLSRIASIADGRVRRPHGPRNHLSAGAGGAGEDIRSGAAGGEPAIAAGQSTDDVRAAETRGSAAVAPLAQPGSEQP